MRKLSVIALVLASVCGCGTIAGSLEHGMTPFRGVEYDIKTVNRAFRALAITERLEF